MFFVKEQQHFLSFFLNMIARVPTKRTSPNKIASMWYPLCIPKGWNWYHQIKCLFSFKYVPQFISKNWYLYRKMTLLYDRRKVHLVDPSLIFDLKSHYGLIYSAYDHFNFLRTSYTSNMAPTMKQREWELKKKKKMSPYQDTLVGPARQKQALGPSVKNRLIKTAELCKMIGGTCSPAISKNLYQPSNMVRTAYRIMSFFGGTTEWISMTHPG